MPPNEEEDPNIFARVDGDDDDELEEDLEGVESDVDDDDDDDEEEDLNLDSPSTSIDDPNNKTGIPSSSSTLPPPPPPPPPPPLGRALPIAAATTPIVSVSTVATSTPTVATSIPTVVPDFSPEPKRQRINEMPTTTATEEKKPSTLDDSRRLFQRLWTDEDEIGLLQGFLDYTKQRGHKNSSHHHDTAPFYDQIKTKLQLGFNKNQLVEKLRRLKKKYRNVMSRIDSGKDFSFKSPHDQATFEISRKIWSDTGTGIGEVGGVEEDGGGKPPQNIELNNHSFGNNSVDVNDSEKKVPRTRKRSRKRVEEHNVSNPSNLSNIPVGLSIPTVIEDTVRSCLSPLFKELLYSAINGPCNVRGLGGMALNPLPLNFGSSSSMNLLSGEMVDEKWRKQHILELEVYSKRMELVQDQIKVALEELKSMGSS